MQRSQGANSWDRQVTRMRGEVERFECLGSVLENDGVALKRT